MTLWTVEQSVLGNAEVVYRVDEFDWFRARPNEYGRFSSYMSGNLKLTSFFEVMKEAKAELRKRVPPHAGRYGHRGSLHRREYCEAVAAYLNERKLFPKRNDVVP